MAGSVQDDIRRFQLEINTSNKNGETLAQLTKLEKETAKLRNENTELQKVMAHLAATGKKNSDEYKRMEEQLKLNRKTIKQNSDEMKGLQKNLDLNYMSMGQLRKRATELRSILNSMSKAANPEEYNRLEKELGQVGGQMDKLKGKTNQTKLSVSSLKESAKGFLPAFGWGALITAAVTFTKKMAAMAEQIWDAQKTVKQFTGETGPALIGLTAKLQATSKTFEVDFKKLTEANHNFAESMDISERQANKLINEGFLAGADASGEFLDRLREYGPQFKAAGISAEQAIALMTQEVKTGIYSDKGTDAIKEATLALREMPQTARDAVDAIGLSSKEMMEQLASGEITVFEAMQQVSRKMKELPPQSAEVGQAMADIFKGAGEDAGLDYILMLGEVEASMDDLITKGDEIQEANRELLQSNESLALSWGVLFGESNAKMTKFKAGFQNFASAMLVLAQTKLFGTQNVIESLVATMDEKTAESTKKTVDEISNLNRLIILAQKELNVAQTKSIRKRGEEQIAAENERWQKEKEILEARLITKANLNEQELKLNDTLHKLIQEKERYHQEVLASIKIKGLQNVKTQALADVIKVDKLDTSDLEADGERHIQAAIAFEQAKADAVKKYRLFSLEDLQAEEMSMLQKAYDEKLISEEIFQQAKLEIEQRYAEIQAEEDARLFQEKIAKYQEYIATISMAASGFSQVVQNLQASEFEDLEARREQGKIDEKQYEEESLKIKKKYADKQFIAALANIIASTAQGVMQAYAHFDPITASILATIPIAVGATEASLANKQRQRVKSLEVGGFAGYTGPGSKYEKKQLTQLHGDEYVIPKEGTNNPNLAPLIALMEQQRVAGTIGSMNFPKVVGAASGGYTTVQNSQSENLFTGNSIDVIAQNTAVMQMLLTKGVKAAAYFDNETTRDIKEQQDEDQRLLDQTKG